MGRPRLTHLPSARGYSGRSESQVMAETVGHDHVRRAEFLQRPQRRRGAVKVVASVVETEIAVTPASTARLASSTRITPLSRNGPPHCSRSHAMSCQAGGGVCIHSAHRAAATSPSGCTACTPVGEINTGIEMDWPITVGARSRLFDKPATWGEAELGERGLVVRDGQSLFPSPRPARGTNSVPDAWTHGAAPRRLSRTIRCWPCSLSFGTAHPSEDSQPKRQRRGISQAMLLRLPPAGPASPRTSPG